jgi:hypothetical protein
MEAAYKCENSLTVLAHQSSYCLMWSQNYPYRHDLHTEYTLQELVVNLAVNLFIFINLFHVDCCLMKLSDLYIFHAVVKLTTDSFIRLLRPCSICCSPHIVRLSAGVHTSMFSSNVIMRIPEDFRNPIWGEKRIKQDLKTSNNRLYLHMLCGSPSQQNVKSHLITKCYTEPRFTSGGPLWTR